MAFRASLLLASPSLAQSQRKAACSIATLRRRGCDPGSSSAASRDAFLNRSAVYGKKSWVGKRKALVGVGPLIGASPGGAAGL